MSEPFGFLTTLTFLLLFGSQHPDDHGNVQCPSCEQLESRNAGNNVNDDCHDYFEFVCENITFLDTDVGKHFESIVSKSSDAIPVKFAKIPRNKVKTEIRNLTGMIEQPLTKLECITESEVPFSPRLSHRWRKDGIKLSKHEHLKYRDSLDLNGSLTIIHLSPLDSGNYSCEVFDGKRLVLKSFVYLSVEYPANITDSPDQYLQLGKKGVINCYASANPPIQFITWLKDRKLFDVQSIPGFSILPNNSILIENVTKKHEGRYQCTAYNSHGTMGASRPMQILVKDESDFFSAFDSKVEENNNETIRRIHENLFVNPKKYKSQITKIPKTKAKASIDFSAFNETNADITLINNTLVVLFSKQRNQEFDLAHKEKIRMAVTQLFQSYNLNTEIQKFNFTSYFNGQRRPSVAKNLIGILPSVNYEKPGDRIVVIGAHYDTVFLNPGIDDNGSGSAFVLEVARLLSKNNKRLNATIYFVLFDQEETGLEGSIAFVDEYLIPNVLDRKKATFVGAFLADMLLLYDDKPDVQVIAGDIAQMCPDSLNWIANNSFRGDFVSVWARDADLNLWRTFKESWESGNENNYKILLFNPPIAANYRDVKAEYMRTTFYRSDHASFWSSARKNPHVVTLPTVLLSDLGPWRGYQRMCYHQPCDNNIQLTKTNLKFLAHTVDSTVASVVKIAKTVESGENIVH